MLQKVAYCVSTDNLLNTKKSFIFMQKACYELKKRYVPGVKNARKRHRVVVNLPFCRFSFISLFVKKKSGGC